MMFSASDYVSSTEDATEEEGARVDPTPSHAGYLHRLGFFNDSFSLDVLLSVLKKTEYATLLANPSIMVLDNETATFETVREVPYTERPTSGGEVLTSTQFKSVGVQLEVTPHIARDGMVRLKVKPEFGVVVDIDENGETIGLF